MANTHHTITAPRNVGSASAYVAPLWNWELQTNWLGTTLETPDAVPVVVP
jgi:hypothetical protein